MFDFVNKKKRIVQIVLAVATLPFLFWGIESYRTGESEDTVAQVAGEKISRQEFEQALREQQDSMRAAMGENFNADLLNRPEMRSAVLDGLIQQRLLKHESARVGLAVPDDQLVEMIRNISAFQENGDFSKQRYEELLRGQGMTPRAFEARVRQELMRQQLVAPFSEIGKSIWVKSCRPSSRWRSNPTTLPFRHITIVTRPNSACRNRCGSSMWCCPWMTLRVTLV